MADQETMTDAPGAFDPTVHGLWKRYVDNYQIRDVAWVAACEANRAAGMPVEFVGTCRKCGDMLVPRQPWRAGTRWDYEAECRSRITESRVDGRRVVTGCGAVLVAPGGRLVKPQTARYHRTGA